MPAATKPITGAGTKFRISAALPATNNAAGFQALTFTQVGRITNIGEFLRNFNLIEVKDLSTRQTVSLKGSFKEGAPPIGMNYVPGDPGQQLMLTALNDDDEYSFEIELNDGTSFYATGLVTGFPISVSDVDSVVAGTANVTFNSQVVVVYPT